MILSGKNPGHCYCSDATYELKLFMCCNMHSLSSMIREDPDYRWGTDAGLNIFGKKFGPRLIWSEHFWSKLPEHWPWELLKKIFFEPIWTKLPFSEAWLAGPNRIGFFRWHHGLFWHFSRMPAVVRTYCQRLTRGSSFVIVFARFSLHQWLTHDCPGPYMQ